LVRIPSFSADQLEVASNRWGIAKLTNGKVVGDMRLIATRDNEVLGQLQSLHGIADPEKHWSLRQWRLRRPRRLRGTAVVIAAASGSNYYHWLFDSLPRLHLLRLAGLDSNRMESFLINGTVRRFDVASLALLGVPPERVSRCSKRQITIVEQLVVPPMPTPRQGEIAPWMCDFLRAAFLSQIQPSASGARLYLSRRNSPKRRLANEAQVESFFCDRGFTSVCPEALSFREQVQSFAGAAFVAGSHGAGFANLVFAPPNTKVIELFHPKHQGGNYRDIANIIGMKYRCVIGESPDGGEKELSEKLGPFTVSLKQLRESLAEVNGD
jgi:capsular polysaccharide biosynthesis protein